MCRKARSTVTSYAGILSSAKLKRVRGELNDAIGGSDGDPLLEADLYLGEDEAGHVGDVNYAVQDGTGKLYANLRSAPSTWVV